MIKKRYTYYFSTIIEKISMGKNYPLKYLRINWKMSLLNNMN